MKSEANLDTPKRTCHWTGLEQLGYALLHKTLFGLFLPEQQNIV